MLTPFVNLCFADFTKNLSNKKIEEPSYEVKETLKKALYKELFILSYEVFYKEFSHFLKENKKNNFNNTQEDYYYKQFIKTIIKDNFTTIFSKFPVLARLISTKTHRYSLFITNIIERFTKDKSQIEAFFNIDLGELTDVQLNAGDQHNGESTAILVFSNSFKLVYKPTDLSITQAYNQLLDWVNHKLNENLKSFKVLDKHDYGWIEFVKALGCNSKNDIKKYYKRAGILSGLAYFLNSRDYHYENVIASGDCPVLIDHETILGPQIKLGLFHKTNKVDTTILESMLLPTYEKDITLKCGFGSIQQKRIGNFVYHKVINCNKDNMCKVSQIGKQRSDLHHIPKLNKQSQFLENHTSHFLEGLKEVYHLVLKYKEFLLSERSPLTNFENKKIRHIVRPTKVYGKLLHMLNAPKYLKDAKIYGLKLEVLARTYIMYKGLGVDLLDSEREQIMLGDIPVFYASTSADHVTLPNGKKSYLFEKSAVESVRENFKNASLQDLEHQISLIKEVLALT